MVKQINILQNYGILALKGMDNLFSGIWKTESLYLYDNLDRLHREWSVLASWAYYKYGLHTGHFEMIVNFADNSLRFIVFVRKEGKDD